MKKPSNKTTDLMYQAIAKYIGETGGSAVVIGGVSVGQNPGSLKMNYFIQIDITGEIPKK